jgi:hypothetical protein
MRESASVHDSRALGEHGPLDPAEACTELGAEDPETLPEAFWVWLALTAIVVTVLVADLVLR